MLVPVLIVILAAAGIHATDPSNGEHTTIEDFPSVVGVEYNGLLRCGGVVVGATHILTAGQCTESLVTNNLQIRLGSTQSLQGGELHHVHNVTYFPLDVKGKEFDIAIITVAGTIRFGSTVQPVTPVPEGKEPDNREPLTIVGWGTNSNSTVLQRISLPATDAEVCRRALETDLKIMITKSMICAGNNEQQRYSFKGETGGPLFNAKKELVGIASWDIPTKNLDYPKAFNSIANHHINEFVRKYSLQ